MKYKLLSDGKINHKIKKNIKLGYNTYSLNFAHSDLSGYNVCPIANKLSEQENNSNKSDCSSCCVGNNGFASYQPSVLESRIKKTISYFLDRKTFLQSLIYEISRAIDESNKKGLKPSFRLNAYSDIKWEKETIGITYNDYKTKYPNNKLLKDYFKKYSFINAIGEKDGFTAYGTIFNLFPDVKFYDYTKLLKRTTPENYQLTYSHYKSDFIDTSIALKNGLNCAIVFEKLPRFITINSIKYTVINGDTTDLRIDEKINGKTVVIGLKFKGSKKKLNNAILEGFAISKENKSLKY